MKERNPDYSKVVGQATVKGRNPEYSKVVGKKHSERKESRLQQGCGENYSKVVGKAKLIGMNSNCRV